MNYKIFNGTTLINTVTTKKLDISGLQPSTKYTFGVQANNGLRDGVKKTIDVTTRGARFIIPKTITAGTSITLRYVEYPFGFAPIGTEPAGMFGGGNKQNLSAKVISTSNGSSVVEVAGNFIDVGNPNLLTGNSLIPITKTGGSWLIEYLGKFNGPVIGKTYTASVDVLSGDHNVFLQAYKWDSNGRRLGTVGKYINIKAPAKAINTFTWPDPGNTGAVAVTPNLCWTNGSETGSYSFANAKLEEGSIATPYASFQDGSTFTKQADGTYALFSEHKAIYY